MGWIADLLEQIPSAAAYKVQLEKLDSDYRIIKAENSDLRVKLANAQSEIDRLKKEAQEKVSHGSNRSTEEDAILVFLAENSGASTEMIAAHFKRSEEATRFYLNDLTESEFITFTSQWGRGARISWYLEQNGRRYLMQRGLLK
jgi:response regulator of citrate/malate metabolism